MPPDQALRAPHARPLSGLDKSYSIAREMPAVRWSFAAAESSARANPHGTSTVLSPQDPKRASAHVQREGASLIAKPIWHARDRGFRRTKAVAGSRRANLRTRLSLRIIVPPLWMPHLNPRSIEPLVTVPLVSVHPKCAQAKRRKQCLTAWKVTGLTRPCDAHSVRASLVSSGIIRGERRFAPGSASIASRRAAKVTTIG
jgi:hypothetical protein